MISDDHHHHRRRRVVSVRYLSGPPNTRHEGVEPRFIQVSLAITTCIDLDQGRTETRREILHQIAKIFESVVRPLDVHHPIPTSLRLDVEADLGYREVPLPIDQARTTHDLAPAALPDIPKTGVRHSPSLEDARRRLSDHAGHPQDGREESLIYTYRHDAHDLLLRRIVVRLGRDHVHVRRGSIGIHVADPTTH